MDHWNLAIIVLCHQLGDLSNGVFGARHAGRGVITSRGAFVIAYSFLCLPC